MKESKLYCCFSVHQRDYISSKNIRYELVALNPNTQNKMWIYIKDDKLNNTLQDWSKGSK